MLVSMDNRHQLSLPISNLTLSSKIIKISRSILKSQNVKEAVLDKCQLGTAMPLAPIAGVENTPGHWN